MSQNPSSQEQEDLKVLQVAMQKLKLDCYDGQLYLLRLTPEQLTHTGHKSIHEGLLYRVRSAQRKIDALIKAHLRRYPD